MVPERTEQLLRRIGNVAAAPRRQGEPVPRCGVFGCVMLPLPHHLQRFLSRCCVLQLAAAGCPQPSGTQETVCDSVPLSGPLCSWVEVFKHQVQTQQSSRFTSHHLPRPHWSDPAPFSASTSQHSPDSQQGRLSPAKPSWPQDPGLDPALLHPRTLRVSSQSCCCPDRGLSPRGDPAEAGAGEGTAQTGEDLSPVVVSECV